MNLQSIFAKQPGRIYRAALVGAGQFGETFIAQSRAIPAIEVAALCDLDVDRAVAVFQRAGYPKDAIVVCQQSGHAADAIAAGKVVATGDAALLAELPVDLVADATGNPEAAARTACAAIAAGKHVAMATKEADSVVGPVLFARAQQAGVVYTPVDGDQPSLLIGLLSWAALLGLEVVMAGKATEYDIVLDADANKATSWGRTVPANGLEKLWRMPADDVPGTLARRALAVPDLVRCTVPDLCEMSLVANATGLRPDRPSLHAPIARPIELADVFRPHADGGVLTSTGVVDVFPCFRRPDEISFAGGVFIIARTPDKATGALFKEKGIPVSSCDGYVMLHNPVHLLGCEAPLSMLSACQLGLSTGGPAPRPVVDLVARATASIPAGTTLELGARHAIPDMAPTLEPARAMAAGNPAPYYAMVGATVTRELAAGDVVTMDMLEPPVDRQLWALRVEQDKLFLGA